MTDVRHVYRLLDARLPHHAGASTAGLAPTSVDALGDRRWLAAQIAAAGRLYRCGDQTVLGVLWWYSASSVLVAPTVESLLVTGFALDPARVRLYLHPDGRLLAARSDAVCPAPGPALRAVLSAAIDCVSELTGARGRALWAVAGDSLSNRVLWAGGSPADAVELAAAIGPMPVPRFVSVGGRNVVRRASCCLIYAATGAEKCVSCPRQPPAERMRRLRGL
ncbi:(2Fe-2S)-binding protein [Actinokineospora iranica]|uniref:FhuF 2Fe-2S C-terminal domain-containing protein n=1 Tax=Actinokineospora iranica TaxID=1271860 RepID=A0A1G6NCB0_9PSEU|nr:(2Fe-2S)-binding protein [Actinokineospora iranica]SDC65037.1 FhuF 2Fe-2S C-terminal domain-containing protein [Actinokineospora iranica]